MHLAGGLWFTEGVKMQWLVMIICDKMQHSCCSLEAEPAWNTSQLLANFLHAFSPVLSCMTPNDTAGVPFMSSGAKALSLNTYAVPGIFMRVTSSSRRLCLKLLGGIWTAFQWRLMVTKKEKKSRPVSWKLNGRDITEES